MSEDRPKHPVPAEWRSRLLELPRLNKRIILVALDFGLLSLALWISISIRYNTLYAPPDWFMALVLFSGPVITVMTFSVSGLESVELYRGLADTPLQFGGVGAGCGTVVLWARRGGTPEKQ